ncbi:hypothetical protein, partial [Rubritalea tangerina]|uniref:hypothetical protein n=1 Tax=Rubritalea tangerina TaxID=430798 RepID=UPI003613206A
MASSLFHYVKLERRGLLVCSIWKISLLQPVLSSAVSADTSLGPGILLGHASHRIHSRLTHASADHLYGSALVLDT